MQNIQTQHFIDTETSGDAGGVSQGPGVNITWVVPGVEDSGAELATVAALLIERVEHLGLDLDDVLADGNALLDSLQPEVQEETEPEVEVTWY